MKQQGMGSNPIVDIFYLFRKPNSFFFYFSSPNGIVLSIFYFDSLLLVDTDTHNMSIHIN